MQSVVILTGIYLSSIYIFTLYILLSSTFIFKCACPLVFSILSQFKNDKYKTTAIKRKWVSMLCGDHTQRHLKCNTCILKELSIDMLDDSNYTIFLTARYCHFISRNKKVYFLYHLFKSYLNITWYICIIHK